jgi:predicted SAM-dependent methyltransferase
MSKLKLHLGCGFEMMPGWEHIDKFVKKPGVKNYDITEPMPYKDNSVDLIFHSHMFEHLPRPKIRSTLKEWHRILRPGGFMAFRLPHAPSYLKKWLDKDDSYRFGEGLNCILGIQENHDGMLNKGLYNESMMKLLMEEAGFKIVELRRTSKRAGPYHMALRKGELDRGIDVDGVDKHDMYVKVTK